MNGATGLGYDASGNLTGYNGMTLSWDNWGQLIGATNTPLGNVTYTYDALGRRASKTVSGSTTLYLYDGDTLIGEVNGATGQLIRSYTWGVTGLISDHSSTGSRYYMLDPAGHTRALLDANGNILAQQAYTPYGQQIMAALPTSFAWNGAYGNYTDPETGLLFMRARYYSPSIGRFISRDPVGFMGGLNVYAYCNNEPINLIDEDGTFPHGRQRLQTNDKDLIDEDGKPYSDEVLDKMLGNKNISKELKHKIQQLQKFKGGRNESKRKEQTGKKNQRKKGDSDKKCNKSFVPSFDIETSRFTISRDTVEVVGAGATLGLVAYGTYRFIRFLPSMAPPLWWTIPANVMVP